MVLDRLTLRHLLVWIWGGVAIFSSGWISGLLEEAWTTWSPRSESYLVRRAKGAFQNFPIDDLRKRLVANAPPGGAVSLGSSIYNDPFLRQRVTEGIYPFQVDQSSPVRIDMGSGLFYIVGNGGAPPGLLIDRQSHTFVWIDGLLAIVLCLGFGLWCANLTLGERSVESPVLCVSTALVTSAIACGLFYSGAAIFQAPIDPMVVKMAGLLLFFVFSFRIIGLPGFRLVLRDYFKPDVAILGAVTAFILALSFSVPITLWDARSIWFFHAKQIFFNKSYLLSDITNQNNLWSHPDYPLLFPSWIANFISVDDFFNERLGGLSIGVLFCGCIGVLWVLARRVVGRWRGLVLWAVLSFGLAHICISGYVDGFVTLFLLTAALAFEAKGLKNLALGLLTGAALLKFEGGVLALLIGLVYLPFRSYWKLGVIFFPAAVFYAWTYFHGLQSVVGGGGVIPEILKIHKKLFALLGVLPAVLSRFDTQHHLSIIWIGLSGFLIRVLFLQRLTGVERRLIFLGLGGVVFSFLSVLLLPQDPVWFAYNTLDRLLIHGCAFLIVVPLLIGRENVDRSQI